MTKIQIGDMGYLEIGEQVSIPISYSILEIQDLSKRRGGFSKSIQVEGTPNNNDLLGYYFNVNISESSFDIHAKVDVIVIQEGISVFEGIMQLTDVTVLGDSIKYTIILKDETSDFYFDLSDKLLTDLDFSDYDHYWSAGTIIDSFNHDSDDIYKYVHTYTTTNTISTTTFYPGIYAKSYFDEIFKTSGYRYEWDSLYEDKFDKLIIPYNGERPKTYNPLGRIFRVGLSADTTYSPVTNYSFEILKYDDDSTEPNTNPNLLYDRTTGYFYSTIPQNGTFITNNNFIFAFNAPVDVELKSTWPNYPQLGNFYLQVYLAIYKSGVTTPVTSTKLTYNVAQNLASAPNITNLTAGYNFFSHSDFQNCVFPNVNLEGDAYYTLKMTVQTSFASTVAWYLSGTTTLASSAETPTIEYYRYNSANPNANYFHFTVSEFLRENDFLSLNSFIPKKIKQKDFINSIFKKYNIYSEIDKNDDKKLVLKTRNDYYDQASKPYFQCLSVTRPIPVDGIIRWGYRNTSAPANNQNRGAVIFADSGLTDNQILDLIKQVTIYNLKFIDTYPVPNANATITDNKMVAKNFEWNYVEDGLEIIENSAEINQKDWTYKLDYNQSVKIEDIKNKQKSRLVITDKSDSDDSNKKYTDFSKEIYGQIEYTFESAFLKDTNTIETIFSPTPIVKNNLGMYVPSILSFYPNNNIRILYDGDTIEDTTWTMGTIAGEVQLTGYTFFGHFDNPFNPTIDINFGSCDFLLYDDYQNLTYNNFYYKYWRRTVSQLETGKLLTAKFKLTLEDVVNIKLSDRIYVKDCWYNINKINDYNANDDGLTEIELITADDFINLDNYNIRRATTPPFGGGEFEIEGIAIADDTNINDNGSSNLPGGSDNNVNGDNNIVWGQGLNIVNSNNSIVAGRNNEIQNASFCIANGSGQTITHDYVIAAGLNTFSSGVGGIVQSCDGLRGSKGTYTLYCDYEADNTYSENSGYTGYKQATITEAGDGLIFRTGTTLNIHFTYTITNPEYKCTNTGNFMLDIKEDGTLYTIFNDTGKIELTSLSNISTTIDFFATNLGNGFYSVFPICQSYDVNGTIIDKRMKWFIALDVVTNYYN